LPLGFFKSDARLGGSGFMVGPWQRSALIPLFPLEFKVTRERVRQIQEIALNKLRRRVEVLDKTISLANPDRCGGAWRF
jgi:hypothetical protein